MSRTGASSSTASNIVLGAGVLKYKLLGTEGEYTQLGATRGGATFDPGMPMRDIEFDGSQGGTKGLVVRDKGNPTLSCTILEITANNLALLNGSKDTAGVITYKNIIENTDYIKELVWEGLRIDHETSGAKLVRITLNNVLVREPSQLTSEDNGEATISVVFSAHFDLAESKDAYGYAPIPAKYEIVS